MSYVPSKAMKHAHAETAHAQSVPSAAHALEAVAHPPLWTVIAAGVAGAVGTALLLSLRSSSRTPPPPPHRRRAPARKKQDG